MPRLWGALSCFCLTSDICLPVAYIGNNSRTERPWKTKIGTQPTSHVTRTPLTRSKVNLQGRGNIVADSRTSLMFINSLIFMGPQLLEAIGALGAAGVWDGLRSWAAASGPQRRPAYSGWGHIVSPRAQLLCFCFGYILYTCLFAT